MIAHLAREIGLASAAFAASAVLLATASAQQTMKSTLPVEAGFARPITGKDAAELLVRAGRIAEAKRVLTALERADPGDSEVQFLLGLIATQEKDYAEAIRRFRKS